MQEMTEGMKHNCPKHGGIPCKCFIPQSHVTVPKEYLERLEKEISKQEARIQALEEENFALQREVANLRG
jgi:hypothetical protein